MDIEMKRKIWTRALGILTCAGMLATPPFIVFEVSEYTGSNLIDKFQVQFDMEKNALRSATMDAFNNGEISYKDYKETMYEIDQTKINLDEIQKYIDNEDDMNTFKETKKIADTSKYISIVGSLSSLLFGIGHGITFKDVFYSSPKRRAERFNQNFSDMVKDKKEQDEKSQEL